MQNFMPGEHNAEVIQDTLDDLMSALGVVRLMSLSPLPVNDPCLREIETRLVRSIERINASTDDADQEEAA